MIQDNPPQQPTIPENPHLLSPSELLQIYKPFQFGIKNHYNKQDPRVPFINPQWITNKKILDIGCGQGNFSLQLAIRYFPQSILGIDLSEIMIKCIQQQSKHTKNLSDLPINSKKLTNNISTIYPRKDELLSLVQQLPDSIIYKSENNQKHGKQFKQSKQVEYIVKNIDLELSLGHNKKILKQFPDNLQYKCCNFFQLEDEENKYDTILCMSVCKCVHLTFGQQVIKLFFKKIYSCLRSNGVLILEIQEYKSYKSDSKNSKINKKHFEQLTLKPKQYINYLQQIGFKLLTTSDSKQHKQLKKSILTLFKQ